MTGPAGSGSQGDAAARARSAAKRSHEVARERAAVEEVVVRLRADEARLVSELAALRAERAEIGRELTAARDRVASLDEELETRRLALMLKEREVYGAREKLERERDLVSKVEGEIAGHRRQLDLGRKGLGDLVENVLRIRHKLRRVAR
jgi:chromosome segregation ATPase